MKRLRIPPLLKDIVQSGLVACDGMVFDSRNACPLCGGKLSGYDAKKKQFAIIQETDELHPVHVFVKRFTCRECHTICFADEPFYPDTRIGSPLVDLCRTLGATMPFNRAAANLLYLGIVIDRGTVRNYMNRSFPDIPTTDLFGMHLPLSVLSLADLATRFGEGSRIPGTEALAACGFPSAYRAAPNRLLPLKQGQERKEEEYKEKRQADHP
ncbi:MAG: hypothetical protein LUQ04_11190 [Methanoregula sp.]|nr:hypothetical protein [Methanoregula sp.]